MSTQLCNKILPRENIIVDMCFLKLEAILPIPFATTIQCKHAAASRRIALIKCQLDIKYD